MSNVNNFFGKVGRSLTGAANISEAITLAGLNFEVQSEAVRDIRGNVIPDTFNIARVDNGESLGVNGARYTPVQTSKAFSYMDDLAKQTGLTYHRGGMLKGGRFFVSVEFDELDLAGDKVSAFGVFLSSFDGTWANRMVSVFNRAACMNICGYTLKERDNGNVGLAAKHTENVEVKLDTLTATIAMRQARQIAAFEAMQKSKFSSVDMADFAAKLFPNKSTQAENAREKLIALFTDAQFGHFGATRWDAFNAVTALETHESCRRQTVRASADENAFDALVSNKSLSNRAAELLVA
jgi:phage/plasmid-like protein (TIGR03299 family)